MINWAIPEITDEDVRAVAEAIKTGFVSGTGPIRKEFETAFARRVGAKYAIAMCNGTMSLVCGLIAIKKYLDLQCCYTIAVPTFTFIATANSAKMVADNIDLIDCLPLTFNINPSGIVQMVDVIMPVDVGGNPVDYDGIKRHYLEVPKIKMVDIVDEYELTRKMPSNSIPIIFADSAEAVGAEYKGKPVGSIADLTSFSFHATKIITSGEGGMLTTDNETLYNLIDSINNQGYVRSSVGMEYNHPNFGLNFRMPEASAALGLSQLKRLDQYLAKRERLVKIYREQISNVEFQRVEKDCKSSNFLFSVLVDSKIRNEVAEELIKAGIQVKLTWKPVHKQSQFENLGFYLPIAENIASRIISLPLHNCLTEEQAVFISETFNKIHKEKSK